jgi:hypothetical protein
VDETDDPKRERWSATSIVVLVLGALFGAHSLLYPYGRDQSLFHYIGREWVHHGAVPYRDTFDLKPPLIYLIHGLCILVFGDVMWGIRLVEWLVLVPLLGVLGASLATPRGARPPKLRIAFGVLGANVLYFGFFSFWDTAQCEIWCVVACLAAVWIALRTKVAPVPAAVATGLLAGFAFLMKPPAALMVLVIAAALVVREGGHRRGDAGARKRAALSLFVFGVSALAVLGITILYFVKVGAFTELVDVVVNYNREYIKGDRDSSGVGGFIERVGKDHQYFDPWSTIVHGLLVVGLMRGGLDGRDRDARPRWLLAAALLATAVLGVFLQAKFYRYHYGLMVAGELVALLLVLEDLRRILPDWRAKTGLLVGSVLLLFLLNVPNSLRFIDFTSYSLTYVTGAENREWFADKFRQEWIQYYFKDREQIGLWVREHSKPDDRLLVRGYEPSIYVTAQRSYGGRFATAHHLTSRKVFYRRDEWRAQDRADIERIKPRFVVAQRHRDDWPGWPEPPDIDDAKWIEQFGYQPVYAAYEFVILERDK